jgi:MFS family permease
LLGLIEAIPALSLALYGGYVADRVDRRRILLVTLLLNALSTAAIGLVLTLGHEHSKQWSLGGLYALVFVAGIARGFAEPASGALEAQVVPRSVVMTAATWFASTWLACMVIGPVLGTFGLAFLGATNTYLAIAAVFGVSWICASLLQPYAPPKHDVGESIWQSIAIGVRYVTHDQILLGSMALDLFAVLFGGAIALLPVFSDLLKVDEVAYGFLYAAPNLGALVTMLVATRLPPRRNAGPALFFSVAAFGVCMIVFALSENYYLSLAMLFFSGVFDGISVVIRRAIVRLMSPEHLRGRIAAVSMLFIGSSNELGALESGVAAGLLGTRQSVWLGGAVTMLVVGLTSLLAPKLRRLDLTTAGTRKETAD